MRALMGASRTPLGGPRPQRIDEFLIGLEVFRRFEVATQTAALSGQVIRTVATPPFSWMRETVVETGRNLRLVFMPLMVASLVYVLAFASVLFGQIIDALGVADRIAPGIFIALIREIGTWLTYMVAAGVCASALAGDLAARRVRDELDALAVLGVDTIRTLIVPRVLALVAVGWMLSMMVVAITWVGVAMLDSAIIDVPFETALSSTHLSMHSSDIAAALIKSTILGFFIGIVACQKGLNARGGAEGVGRAVSETVLITFFGIWLINSLFNTAYLTLVPDAIGLRG